MAVVVNEQISSFKEKHGKIANPTLPVSRDEDGDLVVPREFVNCGLGIAWTDKSFLAIKAKLSIQEARQLISLYKKSGELSAHRFPELKVYFVMGRTVNELKKRLAIQQSLGSQIDTGSVTQTMLDLVIKIAAAKAICDDYFLKLGHCSKIDSIFFFD